MAAYPRRSEISRRVQDAPALMQRVRDHYVPQAIHQGSIDGVNVEFVDGRFNLRITDTEPILRLNVKTRGNRTLQKDKTTEILRLQEK